MSENATTHSLAVPEDAARRAQEIIQSLEAALRPLSARLPFTLEPATTLNEEAVLAR